MTIERAALTQDRLEGSGPASPSLDVGELFDHGHQLRVNSPEQARAAGSVDSLDFSRFDPLASPGMTRFDPGDDRITRFELSVQVDDDSHGGTEHDGGGDSHSGDDQSTHDGADDHMDGITPDGDAFHAFYLNLGDEKTLYGSSFDDIDLNESGSVNSAELTHGIMGGFLSADRNGDGSLDLEELRQGAEQGGIPQMLADFTFMMADRNRDGKMDTSEMMGTANVISNMTMFFADRNRDGFLDASEFDAVARPGNGTTGGESGGNQPGDSGSGSPGGDQGSGNTGSGSPGGDQGSGDSGSGSPGGDQGSGNTGSDCGDQGGDNSGGNETDGGPDAGDATDEPDTDALERNEHGLIKTTDTQIEQLLGRTRVNRDVSNSFAREVTDSFENLPAAVSQAMIETGARITIARDASQYNATGAAGIYIPSRNEIVVFENSSRGAGGMVMAAEAAHAWDLGFSGASSTREYQGLWNNRTGNPPGGFHTPIEAMMAPIIHLSGYNESRSERTLSVIPGLHDYVLDRLKAEEARIFA